MNKKENIIHFLNQINYTDYCWIWEGSRGAEGRLASFQTLDGEYFTAQQFSYELFREKITENILLVNTCKNMFCVKPYHLKLLTLKEYESEEWPGVYVTVKKAHCPQGHELKEPNLIDGSCRICYNVMQKIFDNQDVPELEQPEFKRVKKILKEEAVRMKTEICNECGCIEKDLTCSVCKLPFCLNCQSLHDCKRIKE